MGREQTRKRQHFLLYLACFLIMPSGIPACGHFPMSWQANEHLADAKSLMVKGNYEGALRKTEETLRLFPRTIEDEAYYLMGIIYAHPQNPSLNLARSLETFEFLISRFPKSNLKQTAEVWVSVLRKIRDMEQEIIQLSETIPEKNNEIRNLRLQLEKLKKIDLGIEEKKRRKAPY